MQSIYKEKKWHSNFIWITFMVFVWYGIISGVFMEVCESFIRQFVPRGSDAVEFIREYYTTTIYSVITLYILCWMYDRNRYIWGSFLPPRRRRGSDQGAALSLNDFSEELYGRSNNTLKMLMWGLLLGFITNFFCILIALLHGDVKFYFDASVSQIVIFIFAFVSTFIQSSSEEMWCRGFMYERLNERYPLWVAILVNGVFFGLLHAGNPSVTVLSIVGICVTGISYSLLRWYTGNIWIAMGIHTGWNFTQNFIFGLPNSGLVSSLSIFHLDAVNGVSNIFYDYGFGVEGAYPAVFIDALLGVICVLLAKRNGRLGELADCRNNAYERYIAGGEKWRY